VRRLRIETGPTIEQTRVVDEETGEAFAGLVSVELDKLQKPTDRIPTVRLTFEVDQVRIPLGIRDRP